MMGSPKQLWTLIAFSFSALVYSNDLPALTGGFACVAAPLNSLLFSFSSRVLVVTEALAIIAGEASHSHVSGMQVLFSVPSLPLSCLT